MGTWERCTFGSARRCTSRSAFTGRLCNLTPQDVRELRDHLLTELEWATFDRELLAGFFNHAHLGVQL